MSEEENTEEEKTETTEDDSNKGAQTEETITNLARATENLRIENDRREKLIEAEAELQRHRAKAGRAEAGDEEKPKVESPQEYAQRIVYGRSQS